MCRVKRPREEKLFKLLIVPVVCLVCASGQLQGYAFGGDSPMAIGDQVKFAEVQPIPVAPWVLVSNDKMWDVVSFLADESYANFKKIHTWQGAYRIRSAEGRREADLKAGFGDELGARDLSDIDLVCEYQVRFAIEAAKHSIFRDIQTDRMYWVDGKDKEHFVIPNTAPVDNRSFVTSDDYVYLDPNSKIPETGYLPGNPKAMNKRAAFREPVHAGRRKHYGNMLDPLAFFGYSLDSRVWEELNGWRGAHDGKSGDNTKAYFDLATKVYQAGPPGKQLYMVSIGRQDVGQRADGGDTGKSSIEMVFREDAGFNPGGYVLYNSDGQKCQAMQWKWKDVDGIYVPSVILEKFVPCPGQTLKLQRESELTECKINEPLMADQFTLKGLGLKEGELLIDKVDRVVKMVQNGEPVRLGAFGDQYVPPPKGSETSYLRRLLLVVNFVILGAVLFWAIWRRMKLVKR